MARREIAGSAGATVAVTIRADAIDRLTCRGASFGQVGLTDLRYWSVDDEVRWGEWEPVPGFPYPLGLPLAHSAYPLSRGSGGFLSSRRAAVERIHYGSVPRFEERAGHGTIAVTQGLTIVTGAGTAWDWSVLGKGLRLGASEGEDLYLIRAVLGPEKLVLSQPYRDPSHSGAPYLLRDDPIAQLYDHLTALIANGTDGDGMASWQLSPDEPAAGTLDLTGDSALVQGSGVQWDGRLVGMRLAVARPTPGLASIANGSAEVAGVDTGWDESVIGATLKIASDLARRATSFQVSAVVDTAGQPKLQLNHPYYGPDVLSQPYQLFDKESYTIIAVAGSTLTLDRPYAGETAAGQAYRIFALTGAGEADAPTLGPIYPYDLVMLASLSPTYAQMLGLYWVDKAARSDRSYDYLLAADHTGAALLDPNLALTLAQTGLFERLDLAIVFDRRRAAAAPFRQPDQRVYLLPGSVTTGDGTVALAWDIERDERGRLPSDRPVMYHLWRASLGQFAAGGAPEAPAESQFELISRDQEGEPAPVLVPSPPIAAAAARSRPSNWPPPDLPILAFDRPPAEGWYSYRVKGVDIFGRHATWMPRDPEAQGAPWYQWEIAEGPRPWYYQDPPGTRAIHPFAVAVLDKVAPPAPVQVEAYTLDPEDPTVLQDQAYLAWREEHPNELGGRVSWVWTGEQQLLAPDTAEFRVYSNLGQDPPEEAAQATAWGRRHKVFPFGESWATAMLPLAGGGRVLQGEGGQAEGVVVTLDGTPELSGVRLEDEPLLAVYLWLSAGQGNDAREGIYRVVGCDAAAGRVMLEHEPGLGGGSLRWALVQLARRYEVFLSQSEWPALQTTTASPIAYAHIGVSAADSRQHAPDARGDAERLGNEGSVGVPARVFRVHRVPPAAPALPAYPERIYATPADYHNRSYFTLLYPNPAPGLRAHVFRALDDSVYKADRALRPRGTPLLPTEYFPSEAVEPRWTAAKREAVCAELNGLDSPGADEPPAQVWAAYRALSDDALRILAGLPGNEGAFSQITVAPLPRDEALAEPGLLDYMDTLDGRATNSYLYRVAYVDGANNRGALSLSTPPVHLRNIVPPRAPTITKALGGDRAITLHWASNREPDLAGYHVYRAESAETARDLRTMLCLTEGSPVGTAVTAGTSPPAVTWADSPVPGLTDFWYRVVAFDSAEGGGNVSAPSAAVQGRAYDDARPAPPTRPLPQPGPTVGSLVLSWTSANSDLRCLVQRRPAEAPEGKWISLSGWLPRGEYTYTDANRRPGASYDYRLRAMDSEGRQSVSEPLMSA